MTLSRAWHSLVVKWCGGQEPRGPCASRSREVIERLVINFRDSKLSWLYNTMGRWDVVGLRS